MGTRISEQAILMPPPPLLVCWFASRIEFGGGGISLFCEVQFKFIHCRPNFLPKMQLKHVFKSFDECQLKMHLDLLTLQFTEHCGILSPTWLRHLVVQ